MYIEMACQKVCKQGKDDISRDSALYIYIHFYFSLFLFLLILYFLKVNLSYS